jgi:hypothetical protein
MFICNSIKMYLRLLLYVVLPSVSKLAANPTDVMSRTPQLVLSLCPLQAPKGGLERFKLESRRSPLKTSLSEVQP